ncbi:sensor histidine kinase [Nitrincola schmidtii]|uniref:sensor histidine kinase n=1 Tax=Nitrincola schmidtii TaxID=1730894 RepID=UPI00197DE896|nr:ATP-binding protein [Nitrincola schmidtii]
MNRVYKEILNQLNLGVIVFDEHCQLLYVNHFIRDNHKQTVGLGQSLFTQFPELPEAWFRKRVESVIMFHNTSFTQWQYRPHLLNLMETRPITGTHELMYQNASLIYLGHYDARELICLVIQDATQTALTQMKLAKTLNKLNQEHKQLHTLNQQLKEAQSQLVQNEKMAAVGQLAAGVAHEINNPMSFIKSNIECLQHYTQRLVEMGHYLESLLQKQEDQQIIVSLMRQKEALDIEQIEEELPELINETLDGAKRIQDITGSLRDFSRLDSSEWQLADIHEGLESTLKIVNHEIKYTVNEIVKDFGKLPKIYCLPSQLNQVFLNLLVNASHAIDKDGKIIIETRFLEDSNQITIRITDNGAGIPKTILSKIFDPFFTTKEIGTGTGLGLSISYGIIQAHQGSIEVNSTIDQGTSFLITLPINPPISTSLSDQSL